VLPAPEAEPVAGEERDIPGAIALRSAGEQIGGGAPQETVGDGGGVAELGGQSGFERREAAGPGRVVLGGPARELERVPRVDPQAGAQQVGAHQPGVGDEPEPQQRGGERRRRQTRRQTSPVPRHHGPIPDPHQQHDQQRDQVVGGERVAGDDDHDEARVEQDVDGHEAIQERRRVGVALLAPVPAQRQAAEGREPEGGDVDEGGRRGQALGLCEAPQRGQRVGGEATETREEVGRREQVPERLAVDAEAGERAGQVEGNERRSAEQQASQERGDPPPRDAPP